MTREGDAIHEFKQLYHATFGVVLSAAESREGVDRLTRLYRAVYGCSAPCDTTIGPVDNGVLKSKT